MNRITRERNIKPRPDVKSKKKRGNLIGKPNSVNEMGKNKAEGKGEIREDVKEMEN